MRPIFQRWYGRPLAALVLLVSPAFFVAVVLWDARREMASELRAIWRFVAFGEQP